MWVYRIDLGTMYAPSGLRLGTGYSGIGQGRNNPKMVAVHEMGSIPPGRYRIGHAHDHPVLGKFVMELTPVPGTQMFGREGFYIHGDSVEHPGEASHGCIVIGLACRRAIDASPDEILEVVAE